MKQGRLTKREKKFINWNDALKTVYCSTNIIYINTIVTKFYQSHHFGDGAVFVRLAAHVSNG